MQKPENSGPEYWNDFGVLYDAVKGSTPGVSSKFAWFVVHIVAIAISVAVGTFIYAIVPQQIYLLFILLIPVGITWALAYYVLSAVFSRATIRQ